MNVTPLEAMIGKSVGMTGSPCAPLSRSIIERYQGNRLVSLIDFCREHSSFYRRKFAAAGINMITGMEDLTRLPLTSEAELRNHGSEMVCVSQDSVARIITIHSSGTTGTPKRLYFTDEDLERTLVFFHQGMQPLVDSGQRVAILLPGATPDSTGHLLAQALQRMQVTSDILGLVENPEQMARQLSEIRPDVLVGFPVQILAVARMAAALALPLGRIRSVLLCSDYIPESICGRLTGLLGCEIFSHYGTVETGLGGGVDCVAHRGMHLREADLLFEIIDPSTAKPIADGEWGEIVFTTLARTGMPLIRYRTGDQGRLLPGPCPCGSHIRRLDKVLGRINQVRTLQNGDRLALHSLDEILLPMSGLLDFRAVLTREGSTQYDKLLLHLVAIPGSESTVLRQVPEALADFQPCRQLEFVLTIDSTSGIHRSKRILEDKREEQRQ
jgi:phenylacetate-coenzyme A ligase PaaK-like adenylate-forming protein